VTAKANRFNGVGISRPSAGVEVIVVGVSTGDVPQAQTELRARFGPNICAVRVAFTAAEQRRARSAVVQLMRADEHWIYEVGFGCGFEPVRVQVTMLDQRRYDLLHAIGLDQLRLGVWLKPVRWRQACRPRTDENGSPTHRWDNAASAKRQLLHNRRIDHPVKHWAMKRGTAVRTLAR
jgi:hypothetical protein